MYVCPEGMQYAKRLLSACCLISENSQPISGIYVKKNILLLIGRQSRCVSPVRKPFILVYDLSVSLHIRCRFN